MADRKRLGILISGRGSNMAALIDAAAAPDCPWQVVLVASNNPDAAGLARAAAAGVPTVAFSHKGTPREAFDARLTHALRAHRADWVALAGYMRLLSPSFVADWAGRLVNIHPSLLPRHKGLDTHARALAAGDREAGASVHHVTELLDDGPVIAQARVPILPGDTPETLAARVLAVENRLYPEALAKAMTDAE